MKVAWTERARAQLRSIHDYIASDSPRYATRMIDRITKKTQQLARFPLSGHVVPEYEHSDEAGQILRQLLEGNYRIVYRVKPHQIQVLAGIHAARQMPPAESMD